jgi:hypothetical protein
LRDVGADLLQTPEYLFRLEEKSEDFTMGGESPISTRNQASGRQSKEVQIAHRRVHTVGLH